MDCAHIKKQLTAFVDNECDPQAQGFVSTHIASCPLCRLEFEEEKAMDMFLRKKMTRVQAPFELQSKVMASLEEAAGAPSTAQFLLRPRLTFVLTSVLLLCVFGIFSMRSKYKLFPIFSEAISSHIKFLQGALPVEISSDKPTIVYRWFDGKLDFAVSVPELLKSGVALKGARLCGLKEKKVAFLIYEKEEHKISVFVVDTQGIRIPEARKTVYGKNVFYMQSERGYNSVLHLKKGSTVGHIYVSDLPEEQMLQFILQTKGGGTE